MDVLSVSACVQAVTSAFRDAAGLVRRIQEKQDSSDGEDCSKQQLGELAASLELGPPCVQGQYNSDLRKFGETYARGDSLAREQLKDVLITLQMAVLSNLTAVWMGIRSLDHQALQIASDDSRVDAVLCLAQWQQRLSSAATAQQQDATPYHLGVHSRPMTPPLTNVSIHSDRSSLGAGSPFTPDEPSEQMASLSIAARHPEPGYAASNSPGQSTAPNSYVIPRPGGIGNTDMPSPLIVRSRPPLSRQESPRLSAVADTLPVRSPHRPVIAMPQQTYQSRPTTETYSQTFQSPVSALGSDNEHFDSNDFRQSGMPGSLESPPINYASLHSPEHHDSRRAPSLGSRTSQAQSQSSDHSTLEPVSILSPNEIHHSYRNDPQQSIPHKASFSSVTSQNIPQHPPPPPPPDPQPHLSRRTPSVSAPIPVLNLRSRTTSSSTSNPSMAYHTSRPSLSLPLTLPSDTNAYLGFCKGAYKLQIGLPQKKAFNTESRPAGLYSTFQVWRCSKCSFEGPMSISAGLPGTKNAGKPEKMFDQRIRVSEGGIPYRWAFLAKCHVTTRGTANGVRDGSFGTFGCLFCSAEGVGRGWVGDGAGAAAAAAEGRANAGPTTPMFGNVESFMQHLEMHRTLDGMPGVEMQGRMKCVVGRIAEVGESFDINLPPLEE